MSRSFAFVLLFLGLVLTARLLTAKAATPTVQVNALNALFQSTNGSAWVAPWDITTEEPCVRFGIVCDDADNIVEISLVDNGLYGPIPPEIGNFPYLTKLDLSDNALTGTIPAEIGNLVQLTMLNLAFNTLEGPIGTWIGNMKEMELLSLGWNGLSGSLPASQLAQLKNLEFIGLSSNPALTGSLGFVSELPNMMYLYCDACDFSGPLPNIWNNLAFEHLVLGENSFSGSIPSQIGNLRGLRFLSFADNLLTGTLPDTMRMLTNVTVLRLDHNQFTGTVDVISNLTSAEVVFLQDNNFQTSDLSAIVALPAIRSLQLQDNCFWQEIPEEICTKDPQITFEGLGNPWMCPLPSCISSNLMTCSDSTEAPICAGGTRIELSSTSTGRDVESSDDVSISLPFDSESTFTSNSAAQSSLPRKAACVAATLVAAFILSLLF